MPQRWLKRANFSRIRFWVLPLYFAALAILMAAPAASATVWYVNDNSTVGDSFTSAVGNDGNNGTTPSTPKRTISAALALVAPGDTVLIDAGVYVEAVSIGVDSITLVGKDSSATVIRHPSGVSWQAYGISATGPWPAGRRNLSIQNLGVTSSWEGVHFSNVDGSVISGCRFWANGTGISLGDQSETNTVTGNLIESNSGNGIILFSATAIAPRTAGNTISGNAVRSNGGQGIVLTTTSSNSITGNIVDSHPAYGIWLTSGANNNSIADNIIRANATSGIMWSGGVNTVTGNTIGPGPTFIGIWIESVSNSTISGNIANSMGYGILFQGSSGNTVIGNVTNSNSQYGIHASGSSNFTVSGNTARFNSAGGIFLGSISDVVSGNTAEGNGGNGITLSGGNSMISENTARMNSGGGLSISGGNNVVTGNTAEANAGYQILLSGAATDKVVKNNIGFSVTSPDSGVLINTTASGISDLTRNWWFTGDSGAIQAKISGPGRDSAVFYPFRLGVFDTATGADTVAPRSPDTVGAVVISETAIRVSWAPTATNEEPSPFGVGLSGYRIYRATTPDAAEWIPIGAVGAATLVHDDAGLTGSGTRYYRVTGYDNHAPFENESWYSDSVASVLLTDIGPPPLPTLLTPSDGMETRVRRVDFSWTSFVDTPADVAEYRLQLTRATDSPILFADSSTGLSTLGSISFSMPDTWYWRVVPFDNDGNGDTSGPWRMFVYRQNAIPVLAVPDTAVHPGGSLVVSASATDTNGDALTYRLDSGPVGLLLDTATGAITWTPTQFGAVHQVVISVTDGIDTATDTFAVTVEPDTVPPPIPAMIAPSDGLNTRMKDITFSWAAVTDSGSGLAEYRLQFIRSADSPSLFADSSTALDTSNIISLSISDTYFWRVVAVDNDGNSDTSGLWRTLIYEQNAPPVFITPVPDATLQPGGSLSVSAAATDADGDTLTYLLDTGPPGLLLNAATGAITWTPAQFGTTNRVVVSVTDMFDTATDTFTVYVAPDTDIIMAFAGNGIAATAGDGGFAEKASINRPFGFHVAQNGDVYIAEQQGHRIRKVNRATGIITTVAGTGVNGFAGDNGPATAAQLSAPVDVFVTVNGDVYIADANNHRVRKIDGQSGIITTVAGTGSTGYNGDGIPATTATVVGPSGVAVDDNNGLLISDRGNSRIRRVDLTTGIIATVAGNGVQGFSGDGDSAVLAQIRNPFMIDVVSGGTFVFADNGNSRIRRVENGVITTVAGNGISGYSGDGGAAESAALKAPTGVGVDRATGAMLIADLGNYRIRRVDPDGIITTVAGTGVRGLTLNGDGGAPTAADFGNPADAHFDPLGGGFFLTEQINNVVRKVTVFSSDTVPPAVPTLLAPANGLETRVPNVNFSWNVVADADLAGYRLQISRSTVFPSLIFNLFTTNTTGGASLAQADTYFWRVASVDTAGNQNTTGPWRTLVRTPNAAPVVASIPDTILHPGEILSVAVSASDADGDSLSYGIAGPANISSAGVISWSPTDTQLGIHQIIVSVGDGIDSTTDTFTVVVNDIPTLEFSSWKDTVVVAGQSISVTARLRDSFTPTTRFSVAGAPAGLVIDPVSGEITWVTDLGERGTYSFQVSGFDGYETATDTFHITARNAHETNSTVAGGEVVRPCCGNSLTIAVNLRDQFDGSLTGFKVTLLSDRPDSDTIVPLNDYTDSYGRALFLFSSTGSGTSVLTASVDSSGLVLAAPHVIVARATNDWYVSPGGSDAANGLTVLTPFRTIAHAIGVADQGDVIHLLSGIYTEAPVKINKSGLTLIGEGVDSVTLQPGSNSVGVMVTDVSDVKILNMTIQSSSLGVKVMNSSNIMIRANKILDNSSAGVWVQNSRAISVLNNLIDNPATDRNSTGMYFRNSSDNCVVSNTVRNHRLGGIILVEESSSHVTSNEIYLDNVPGVGTPPFNKASLIVYGSANIITNNNMFNQSNNRSQLYVAQQAQVSDNFEVFGAPPVIIDDLGYRPSSNNNGTAYCDVNGDGVIDDGRELRMVGYFGGLDPFGDNPTGNLPPVVRDITANGETEGTAVVFDTRTYVIGWNYSDSDGHPQANIDVEIASDSLFGNVRKKITRYQSAETIVIDMKIKGEFYVRVRADDGRQWSQHTTARFVANDTPAQPIGVAAAGGEFSILVGWRPNPDNDGLGGYRVYHSTTPGGPYALAATVTDSLQYLHNSVPPGEARYYVVTAFDTHSPPRESPFSNEVSAIAAHPTGITIDGKFTGWSEFGFDEWAQVGAVVTPGRLSKVYVYSDSASFYIGVDFLMTTFIERIKDDPVLWQWYQDNKWRIFNYFEFRDELRISLSDPNVIPRWTGGTRYYDYREPATGMTYPMMYEAYGRRLRYLFSSIDPASVDWYVNKSSYIRVYGDGRYEISPSLTGSDAIGATAESTSPNDSSIHRVYEIKVPLNRIRFGSNDVTASFQPLNVGIWDWDYPGLSAFLAQPVQGEALGMSTQQPVSSFAAAAQKLEAMDEKTRMSLASSLAVVRAQNDPDLNALLPIGYEWHDGPMQVSPAGTVVSDQANWGSVLTPIEATFHLNTPPVARVPSETVFVSPGAEVMFDGTLSADSEMSELRYLWSQVAGTTLPMANRSSARPVVSIPTFGADTEYRFELTISDRIYNSVSVPLVLTTVQGNNRPSAKVQSPTAYGIVGETITLSGTGSDPNDDLLSYYWSQVTGNSVQAQSVNDSILQFAPQSPGRHVFQFFVIDSGSLHSIDTAVVFVADTIPVLSSSASSTTFSRALALDTDVAIFQIAGTGDILARSLFENSGETTEVAVDLNLATGYENSRLIIARTDSASVRRGTEKALEFDRFARYLVELDLLAANGSSVGSQSAAFDKLLLRFEPRKADIGSEFLSRLRIFTFNEADEAWEEVPGMITEDLGDRIRLSVPLSHFSFYTLAVGVAVPADLSTFTVYPNPFRPNDGDANTGVDYTGATNTGVTFENVPTNSNIRIFTANGESVAEYAVGASGGAQWDVRNGRGEKVASGIYIYIVTAPNGERRVGKLAVIR